MKDYVIGNEPNQPRFWRPQYSTARASRVAAAQYVPVLAASYDALKAVDPAINVIGVGLSPRGNDQPDRDGQPLELAGALPARPRRRVPGERPDEADHGRARLPPVPEAAARAARASRYAWPNGRPREPRPDQAGGLGRVQRHRAADVPGAGKSLFKPLKFDLDEVGWQVAPLPALASLYTGMETPGTRLIERGRQAAYYRDTITLAGATPPCGSLSFFHLVDETDLDRWQSGLERADGSHRPSYDAVKQVLAQSHGNCQTTPVKWRHVTAVVLPGRGVGSLKPQPLKRTRWSFTAGAGEEADFRAGLFKAGPSKAVLGKRLAAGKPKPLLSARGVIKASTRLVSFPTRRLQARPLRLCDPDERHHELQARERPRQPALPRRHPQEVSDPRVARLARARRQLLARACSRARCCASTRRRWRHRSRSSSTAPRSRPGRTRTSISSSSGCRSCCSPRATTSSSSTSRRSRRPSSSRRRDRDDLVGVEHARAHHVDPERHSG